MFMYNAIVIFNEIGIESIVYGDEFVTVFLFAPPNVARHPKNLKYPIFLRRRIYDTYEGNKKLLYENDMEVMSYDVLVNDIKEFYDCMNNFDNYIDDSIESLLNEIIYGLKKVCNRGN